MSKSKKNSHSVSFVIPGLNEERVLEDVVRKTWATIDRLIENYEIILINDGSTDRTGNIMDTLANELRHVRVIHNTSNIGLGASYKRGVNEATLDYVMLFCGDGGLPASSLPPIIERIGTADMVVPYMLNLWQIRTPIRYAISKSYTKLLNLLFGHHVQYYNGLAVHRRALLNQINVTSTGFGFQAEIILKLLKSGYTITEVGVHAAEHSERSRAFRLKNVLDVSKTILYLVAKLRSADSAKSPNNNATQPARTLHRP
jgi:dolichol-phosphate mannosyltransferase